ncbi:MAG TPA: hypothetical protein VHU91_10625 [Mycobacteriales bacterium]|nr:hypothetical protein [Mycobacteriales bacterium]
MGGYVASDVLRELVLTLNSQKHSRIGPPEFRIISATPVQDRWPIVVQAAATSPDWQKPRTFEMSFDIGDFDPEDSGIVPAPEAAEGLATDFLTEIEELLLTGQSGIYEIAP